MKMRRGDPHGRTTHTVAAFKQAIVDSLYYNQGTATQSASIHNLYMALAHTTRDHLVERWRQTTQQDYETNPRFVYYLSAEYLLGKQLPQNLLYTDTTELARHALNEVDLDVSALIDEESEPGLGNGGLGRLAACYLDSLASLDVPAVGYGIRYEHGIFTQTFHDGWQLEQPDNWLLHGNPWEFVQSDRMIEVSFYGRTEAYTDNNGKYRVRWLPGSTVLGEPCTMLVPGYQTSRVNMLRLWRTRASKSFDFQLFNVGDYALAVEQKMVSENISKVLYPNDITQQGRELRLKQQYFFVACSLQDIIRRFHLRNNDWDVFPDKVVIQLNDTHPVIAIPELMRILVDGYELEWEDAWDITRRTFAYTCHTLLPEALEHWTVSLFELLLPRHLEIIYEINRRFLADVRRQYPGDEALVRRLSIVTDSDRREIRMAHLAVVGSFAVNGVAELHTRLLQEQTMPDFALIWPGKFRNVTNGVTPRRFIKLANPRLADLITARIGKGWLNNLERLQELEAFVDDAAFRRDWRAIKQQNKTALLHTLQPDTAVPIPPDALFDVMAKRLHEYKRQLLKVMHIITLYQQLKDDPGQTMTPRLFLFGAKAAPGYAMAKLIIKLINSVAEMVNHDVDVNGRLTVLFPPNFNVTLAEKIYPAADISEQISLAGKEASGTGNMKFALNGAVTVGTLDGANIEIRDRVGAENFFLFGLSAAEAAARKAEGYNAYNIYSTQPALHRVIEDIGHGRFTQGDARLFKPLVDSLIYKDEYLLLLDYADYMACSEAAAAAYANCDAWTRMSILNTARCGYFSSDRAIRQYASDIWRVGRQP